MIYTSCYMDDSELLTGDTRPSPFEGNSHLRLSRARLSRLAAIAGAGADMREMADKWF